MARPLPYGSLAAIEAVLAKYPDGASYAQIEAALDVPGARRTLQYHLRTLVDAGRLRMTGARRGVRYYPVGNASAPVSGDASARAAAATNAIIPLSPEGEAVMAYVHQPVGLRQPVGYDRSFLDGYRPNESFYLGDAARARLAEIGRPQIEAAPAGTYAKQILNHKDAIEFLVANADEIGFNRYTVLNLHALLANNLLADPTAVGRLRHIAVGIEGSAFHPLEVSGQIEESFNQLLATAAAIRDPFEQAFFMMVQLPYLQPFDDVNKRVSRLAANIPMIKANLVPLSFTDVPNDLYARATLGVYERNDVAALRDVFLWAYERSAARYAAVRQSLGEPDPFRLRYRDRLRTTVRDIVRAPLDRQAARAHLTKVAHDEVQPEDQEQFIEIAETELLGLHEGNFARYQVRPSEFLAWSKKWNPA